RRYADAETVIRKLPEQYQLSGDLYRLVAELALRRGSYNDAVEAARRAIRAGSKDFRDYVWLGQVLWLTAEKTAMGREQRRAATAEADDAFKQAAEMGDSAPDGWIALVQSLARSGRRNEAMALLEKIQTRVAPSTRALTLAQCYA